MRKLRWLLALMIPVVIVSCKKDSTKDLASEEATVTGNGAPSGQHYNLNIIGVPDKGKNFENYSGNDNGRRIFVSLWGKTKILLTKGDFDVIDANGTDGTAAFQLPEPDATNDGFTDYCVYIRALGKPGGTAQMYSCFFDQQTATEYCSSGGYIVDLTAHGNNNKFQNVTNQLLYVWADIDGDGDLDRTELFSDPLDTYYWYYDNSGLKIAQLRFYPNCSTEVWADPE
jgi:hypothetical protein